MEERMSQDSKQGTQNTHAHKYTSRMENYSLGNIKCDNETRQTAMANEWKNKSTNGKRHRAATKKDKNSNIKKKKKNNDDNIK